MNELPLELDAARSAPMPVGGITTSGLTSDLSMDDVTMETDERLLSAWRQWLNALATDAEAAHAAAMAYKALDSSSREVWLEALSQDACELGVPKIAIYAPLLAVESDPSRCKKIEAALGASESAATSGISLHALSGVDRKGLRVAAIITPLYLDFVQVLACGYHPGQRFEWVRHDPILLLQKAPKAGSLLGDIRLERTPIKALIDELARTVLGHRRGGEELPAALEVLSDLFTPSLGDDVLDGATESR
jgi:hypothetical protein